MGRPKKYKNAKERTQYFNALKRQGSRLLKKINEEWARYLAGDLTYEKARSNIRALAICEVKKWVED